MVSVTVSGQTTQFVYDGDGNLVKQIKPDESSTIYIGSVYEVDKDPGGHDTRTVTYYPAGGAMRIKTIGSNDVYYILKDHLGSASVVADENGQPITNGKQRYEPFGEARLSPSNMLTDKLFTGQREIADLLIYHYGARFYSPYINHFLSADTIVPDYANPQSLNRYSYVVNNPLRYSDPTGHDYTECGERSNYRCKIHKKKVAEAEARGAAQAAAQLTHTTGTIVQQAAASQGCTGLACFAGGINPFGGSLATGSNNRLSSNPNSGGGHPLPMPNPTSAPHVNSFSYCGGGPNGLYNFLDCGANITQDLALAIDIPFAGLEAVLITAGCFAGPKGCLAGAGAADVVFNLSGANAHETGLSLASMFFSIGADYAYDQQFGESSVVSVAAAVAGALSLDAIGDVVVDGFGSAYNHQVYPIYPLSTIPSFIGSLFDQ